MSILDDDPKAELHDFEVTIKMVNLVGGRSERYFTFVIPAVGEEKIQHAAYQLGLAINDATGHQWKFPREDDEFCEVRRVESTSGQVS